MFYLVIDFFQMLSDARQACLHVGQTDSQHAGYLVVLPAVEVESDYLLFLLWQERYQFAQMVDLLVVEGISDCEDAVVLIHFIVD